MKVYRIIIFAAFILSSFVAKSQNIPNPYSDSVSGFFKIEKIKKSKNYYVIFARNLEYDERTLILSKRSKFLKAPKIVCDRIYYFNLYAIYYIDPHPESFLIPMLVRYKKYNIYGKKITVRGTHYSGEIYMTPDLKGLYYVPLFTWLWNYRHKNKNN